MPPSDRSTALEVRRATDQDLPEVLELAQASLGWRPEDPNEAFFRWKHLDNPAGRSPMWVAVDHGQIVGFRVFLRWRFVDGAGRIHAAGRAVDTATHPAHQGRGIFRQLTLGALAELRRDEADDSAEPGEPGDAAIGIELVFNTPNDQSRPGYLKMGWQAVGRVPIAVRPRSVAGAYRMARARTAASKWSRPTTGGVPASEALADEVAVTTLLTSLPHPPGLRTDRTVEHLRWRYRFEPLDYRAVVAPAGPADGLAVFRVRDRGAAREAVLCEVLVPDGDPGVAARLVREVADASGADYLIGTAATAVPRRALPVPLPRQGPVLTFRAVGTVHRPDHQMPMPPLADWHLTMGDVELF